jgi:hypothetical protein
MSSRPEMIETRRSAIWGASLVFLAVVAAVDFSLTGTNQFNIQCKAATSLFNISNITNATTNETGEPAFYNLTYVASTSTLVQNVSITTWMYIQASMWTFIAFLVYLHFLAKDKSLFVLIVQVLVGVFEVIWGIVGATIVWQDCWSYMSPNIIAQLFMANVVFDFVLGLAYLGRVLHSHFDDIKNFRRAGARNTGRASEPKV